MAQINMKQTAAASADTPASGYGAFCVDSNYLPWLKGSDGVARPFQNGYVATTLSNASITQTEAVITQLQIPANTLTTGSTFNFQVYQSASTTNNITWRVRFGTAGTTADTLISPAIICSSNASANILVHLAGQAVCKSATTWVANGMAARSTSVASAVVTDEVQTSAITASNVNVANYISVTGELTTSGTLTIASASIELIKI